MDWLQFSADVIGHLAWPLVILVLFIILRKHMGALADRLLEFSFGGAKITFDKFLERGAEIIEHSPKPELPDEPQLKLKPPKADAPITGGPMWTFDYQPGDLVEKSAGDNTPAGRIILTHNIINEAIRRIGMRLGFKEGSGVDEKMILFALVQRNAISKEMYELYQQLSNARNLIAHSSGQGPTWNEVIEYARQATFLHEALISLQERIASGEIKGL